MAQEGKTAIPSRKVGGGAVIGMPVGIVLVYVLNEYLTPGHPIPAVVATAIGSICSFVAGYFIVDRR